MSRQKYFHRTRNNTWSPQQDGKLRDLIYQYGHNWHMVSREMKKCSKSCKQRWINQLDPQINRNSWTLEQQWTLFLGVTFYGNQWHEISNMFENRPDKMIKNYWNTQKMKIKREEFRSIIEQVFIARGLQQVRIKKGN